MRILLCSYAFRPSIGGIETVSELLAAELVKAGCEVTVVTNTPGSEILEFCKVIRQPSWRVLRRIGKQADIIVQSNISLRMLLPLMFLGKPLVIIHHTWLTRSNGKKGWEYYAKRAVIRICHNVAISEAVAKSLNIGCDLIFNPIDNEEFQRFRRCAKVKDIVFMGRLVSDKGCDTLLRALSLLKAKGICPSLSLIGDGPERLMLERLTKELELTSQVTFLGAMRDGRAREVAKHKIMVIPSKWNEPFGIVALEGIAAGCAIVASSGGGLPEAVGPCGLVFPNGSAELLALELKKVLTDAPIRERLVESGPKHLEKFRPQKIGREYLHLFGGLIKVR
jgi:glycogen(starch) synthase